MLATPERLDLGSDCRFAEGAREYILGNWDEDAANNKVNVAYHAEVAEVTGAQGAFAIRTTKGDVYTAENIVLAIGTQGNPNRMRCEGADLPHIIYQVDDPEDFKDRHITVVGSGDAGIENALGVAEEALENTVTILNRSKDFCARQGEERRRHDRGGRERLHVDPHRNAAEEGRAGLADARNPDRARSGSNAT